MAFVDPDPDFCIPREFMSREQAYIMHCAGMDDIVAPLALGFILCGYHPRNLIALFLKCVVSIVFITMGLMRLGYLIFC